MRVSLFKRNNSNNTGWKPYLATTHTLTKNWKYGYVIVPVQCRNGWFTAECLCRSAAAHRGLQEEVVHYGRQEAHVLQRPSGKTPPAPSPSPSTGRPLHSLRLSPRTPTPAARSSSAVRRTATPSCPAYPPPPRATIGTTASPSSRRTGSSCSPARPKPSNGIG